jgi:hypothetical protein
MEINQEAHYMSLLHLSAAHSNDYCCVVGRSNSAYISCYINSDETGTKRAARKTGGENQVTNWMVGLSKNLLCMNRRHYV